MKIEQLCRETFKLLREIVKITLTFCLAARLIDAMLADGEGPEALDSLMHGNFSGVVIGVCDASVKTDEAWRSCKAILSGPIA